MIEENGIKYLPAEYILRGKSDNDNLYWDSFLPIFFERITYLMRKAMVDSVEQFGLNNTHAYCLIALDIRGPMTLSQLRTFLDIDISNINRATKVLESKGFIFDDRVSETSKKFKVYLTDSGKELADNIMVKTQDRVNGYFKGVSKEDVDLVRSILIKILSNVDEGLKDYVDSEYTNPFYTYLGTNPYLDSEIPKDTYIPKVVMEKSSKHD